MIDTWLYFIDYFICYRINFSLRGRYCNNCGTFRLGYPFAKNVDGGCFSEKYYFIVSKSGLKILDVFVAVLYDYSSKCVL